MFFRTSSYAGTVAALMLTASVALNGCFDHAAGGKRNHGCDCGERHLRAMRKRLGQIASAPYLVKGEVLFMSYFVLTRIAVDANTLSRAPDLRFSMELEEMRASSLRNDLKRAKVCLYDEGKTEYSFDLRWGLLLYDDRGEVRHRIFGTRPYVNAPRFGYIDDVAVCFDEVMPQWVEEQVIEKLLTLHRKQLDP